MLATKPAGTIPFVGSGAICFCLACLRVSQLVSVWRVNELYQGRSASGHMSVTHRTFVSGHAPTTSAAWPAGSDAGLPRQRR